MIEDAECTLGMNAGWMHCSKCDRSRPGAVENSSEDNSEQRSAGGPFGASFDSSAGLRPFRASKPTERASDMQF